MSAPTDVSLNPIPSGKARVARKRSNNTGRKIKRHKHAQTITINKVMKIDAARKLVFDEIADFDKHCGRFHLIIRKGSIAFCSSHPDISPPQLDMLAVCAHLQRKSAYVMRSEIKKYCLGNNNAKRGYLQRLVDKGYIIEVNPDRNIKHFGYVQYPVCLTPRGSNVLVEYNDFLLQLAEALEL